MADPKGAEMLLDALIVRHTRETAALPMDPPRDMMLAHARRQALELLDCARTLERQRDALAERGEGGGTGTESRRMVA